jgi:hypothetical protein
MAPNRPRVWDKLALNIKNPQTDYNLYTTDKQQFM